MNFYSYELKYRNLPKVQIQLPYDWKKDPFAADQNTTHHFYSLRWVPPKITKWLSGSTEEPNPLKIVEDFLRYHDSSTNVKNPYYMGKPSDHTLSIRLAILLDIWVAQREGNNEYRMVDEALLQKEIKKSIDVMASDVIYQFPHNHGLMVDKMLIELSLRAPEFDANHYYFELALYRAARQIDTMFDGFGFTKEHSLIYQVYNANICVELAEILGQNDIQSKMLERIERIIGTTQFFIQYCIRPNGALPPVGDSFRFLGKANAHQLETVRRFFHQNVSQNTKLVMQTFWSTPVSNSFLVAPDAGFALVRRDYSTVASPVTSQVFFTAGWHSRTHKHNDDLSFTFVSNSVEWIDEPGYSDALQKHDRLFSSERYHNVVRHEKRSWSRKEAKPGGTRLSHYYSGNGVVAVKGTHKRLPETVVTRTLVYVDLDILLVVDQIETSLTGAFLQGFQFGPGINARIRRDGVVICRHETHRSFTGIICPLVQADYEPSLVESFSLDRKGTKTPTLGVEYRIFDTSHAICYLLSAGSDRERAPSQPLAEFPNAKLMHQDTENTIIDLETRAGKRRIDVKMQPATEPFLSTVVDGSTSHRHKARRS